MLPVGAAAFLNSNLSKKGQNRGCKGRVPWFGGGLVMLELLSLTGGSVVLGMAGTAQASQGNGGYFTHRQTGRTKGL